MPGERVRRRRLHSSLNERRAAALSGTSEGVYGPIWEGAGAISEGESLNALLARAEDSISELVIRYARLSRSNWVVTVVVLGMGVVAAYQELGSTHPAAAIAYAVMGVAVVLALRGLMLRIAIGAHGAVPRELVHAIYRSVRSCAPGSSPVLPETLRAQGLVLLAAYIEGSWSFRRLFRHESVSL